MFSLHSVLIQYINKIRYFLNLVLYILNKKHTHYFYLNQIVYSLACLHKTFSSQEFFAFSRWIRTVSFAEWCVFATSRASEMLSGALSQQNIIPFYPIYEQGIKSLMTDSIRH